MSVQTLVTLIYGAAAVGVLVLTLSVAAAKARSAGVKLRDDAVLCAWLMVGTWGLAAGLRSVAADNLTALIFRLLALVAGLIAIGLYQTKAETWKLLFAITFLAEEIVYLQYGWDKARELGWAAIHKCELHLNSIFIAQLLLIASGPLIYVGKHCRDVRGGWWRIDSRHRRYARRSEAQFNARREKEGGS